MNFFSDLKAINKVVLKKTNQAYFKNLLLIPMFGLYLIAYLIIFLILAFTIGQLGNAGSFLSSLITWFISCYMISDFMEHIDNALIGKKVSIKDVGKGRMHHFRPLLTATAVPRIVLYLITALTKLPIPSTIILLFYLIYAIPEIVYQKRVEHLEMFSYGHRFLKENWKHWLTVNAFLGVITYAVFSGVGFAVNPIIVWLTGLIPVLLTNLLLVSIIQLMLVGIIMGIPFMYYFIYRGYIFKILSVSSIRKREYMRNIYGK